MYLISIFTLVDQLSKILASLYLEGKQIFLVKSLLGLTYLENNGLVFSLASKIEGIFFISLFSKILALYLWVMLYKYYVYYYRTSKILKIANALFVSCWLGNIIDLLILGYIRDMIIWPGPGIPNLADIYFYLGLLFLFIELVKNPKIDLKRDIILANHTNTLRFLQSFSLFIINNVKKILTNNR